MLADPGAAEMFDDRVYKRGALLREALRRTAGHAAFRHLLREWATVYAHRQVTGEDFFRLSERFSDQPLEPLWKSWLEETRLPALPTLQQSGKPLELRKARH